VTKPCVNPSKRKPSLPAKYGVTVLLGPEVYPLHEPGTGSNFLHLYPWQMALAALEGITATD
jgi:hypothetical protein